MPFSADQVRWVAHLARLELTPAELETIAGQLSSILDYINQLQEVDTAQVLPLAHPLPLQNVFREDELTPSLYPPVAMANAPDRRGDFYAVPAVLE